MGERVNSVAVIGLQWGDEGKGKIVDLLASEADVVVRYQGGNNAGHTLVVDGQQTVLHVVPSGALHPGKVCIVGGGVVVDPNALAGELDALQERGYLTEEGTLLVSQEAHLILPYHKAVDQARERARGKGKIGTTGRGIGPAYEDKVARRGIRMADLVDLENFRAALAKNLEETNAYLEAMLGEKMLDFEKTFAELEAAAVRLAPLVCDTSEWLHNALRSGRRVLFEGAQGVMLDVDHGTYPFVTSSNTGSGSIATGAGIAPKQVGKVIGITKAYSTRVGSGPFPTELNDAVSEHLREEGGEYGATTGRPRRCGWFDAMVVRKSVRLCGVDALALTKLDVLTGIDRLKICTGYRLDGKALTNLPARAEDLERVEPVFEEVEGWTEDLTGIGSRADLPAAAERYVARLEELVETPVGILSTGPGREQTVILDPPFGAPS